MPMELCPKCGAVRALRVTTSSREETDSDGKAVEIITSSYHCQTCNSFVRSEEKRRKKN